MKVIKKVILREKAKKMQKEAKNKFSACEKETPCCCRKSDG